MPSPFPGMNPYLEQVDVWQDFHQSFLPDYCVKVEESRFLSQPDSSAPSSFARADRSLTPADLRSHSITDVATKKAPAYALNPRSWDVERHAFLEIRDRVNRERITVLKVLSPWNKRSGVDRNLDLDKRQRILNRGVNLVKLDFLRAGPRLPLDERPDCDDYAVVSRFQEWPRAGVWPIRLFDPLPTIPIPLRSPDRDATLDLKAAVDQVYDDAE